MQPTPSAKAETAQKRRGPSIAILLALLAVSGFMYGSIMYKIIKFGP